MSDVFTVRHAAIIGNTPHFTYYDFCDTLEEALELAAKHTEVDPFYRDAEHNGIYVFHNTVGGSALPLDKRVKLNAVYTIDGQKLENNPFRHLA